ncbi:Ig-like domain-containing protein [Marinagarivorans cellulosilyticus]|uniref:Ig-like domain-containing protein n=1 Tax=Marinagarivorans cellulosilyticus TaxID=2721545 RepID=A0AAN1WL94_9GAMM|nr:Ig-like domain-containing protein [Marinagarivorans cellulosilyticus]BCD99667.1 hypothetical protein MARGE09_P3869 [Marinagarivorans cellulosilyticus]
MFRAWFKGFTRTALATVLPLLFCSIEHAWSAGEDILVYQSGSYSRVDESGATDQFLVQLSQAPATDVVVNIVSADITEVTVSAATLTFTAANWSVGQVITLTGQNDSDTDNTTQTNVTLSIDDGLSDDSYDAVADKVITVDNDDNESALGALTDTDSDGVADVYENSCGLDSAVFTEDFGTGARTSWPYVSNTYCYEDGTPSCPDPSPHYGDTQDVNDGEYAVASEVLTLADYWNYQWVPNTQWIAGEDHTPGDVNGRMLAVNGGAVPGVFYQRTVSGLTTNTYYNYSAFFANILGIDPLTGPYPTAEIPINVTMQILDTSNNVLATFDSGDIYRNTAREFSWYPTRLSFNTGNRTEIQIVIKNNSSSGSGNDVAIDDITLTPMTCDTDSDTVPDVADLDSDNDGIPDSIEAGSGLTLKDTDFDGIEDAYDLDSDNDGIFDLVEAGHGVTDANADGVIDSVTAGDNGLHNALEDADTLAANLNYSITNTDGGSVYNFQSDDSDGDSCLDTTEAGFADTNRDGYLGAGAISVDANGVVTGQATGYTTPSSQYTNAAASNTCSPSITISTVAGDNAINTTEDNSDVTVSGTSLGVEDGATVTVTLNGETYTTTVSSNAWSVTVPAADAQALDASETLTADVSNASAYAATQATQAITHTVAAPTINISTVAGDNAINQTEDNSDVTISGTTANVEDGRTVTVTLNGETYTTTVSSNAWSVTVPAADAQALDASETVTADVSNAAGDAASQASQAITHTVAAPTISISTVAGDNAINQTEDNSDVTISGTTANVEDGRTVTVTLNGETYTTTVSSNAWSVTVPAADAQALDASETVTADVSNAAGDVASQASQAITHTVAAPTISISTVAGDNAINQTEDNSDVTISGTTANVEDGRTVTVTLNGETYTTTVSSNAWSVTVPAADAQALGASETVTADVSNAAGDAATQASQAITHTVAAPTINISTVAGDNAINQTEDNSDVTISGTTANVEDGRTVTVTLNGETYTTTVSSNAWSVTVPAADAQALDASETVTADVSNTAGDAATQATQAITHTVAAPTISISTVAGDNAINQTEDNSDVTISGTTANVEDGRTVTVTLNGETYTTTVSSNAWSVTVPAADAQALDASETVTADVSNTAGDAATQATQAITHTVAAPTISISTVAGDNAINQTEDNSDVTISGTTANVEDGRTVTVTLNGETYTTTVSSNAWSVTVPAADAQALDASETITADVSNAAGDVATQGSLAITHTVAAPTISISTVAGDNAINQTEDNSDVTIGGTTANVEDGRTVTVTLNGETYTTTVSSNAWSVTVPAADTQALDASETVTADVSNAAGDVASQASQAITHTVAAPTISISTVAGDNAINQAEDNSDVTISGTTANVEDGRTVTVTLNGETYTTTVSSNAWSVTVPAADAQALDASETVTADVSNAAGDAASQATQAITHTVAAPTISISTVAGDNAINQTEDNSDVTISGTTTNVEDGRTVTVTLNGETYTTTVSSNAWSVTVPAADAQALDASETVTADVSNTAGDAATQATQAITHTVAAPTISISTVAGDNAINQTEDNSDVTISGTTANVEDGRTVTVTLNGETYTTTVSSNAWSVTVPAADAQALDASETVTADVSNTAGDAATQATQAITHTVAAPTISISTVAGDNAINQTEDNSDVTISGTTANVEDGRTVTVTLNGETYTTTVSSNAWSVTVPAADAQALDASETVTADVSNAAGDAASQASQAITHTVAAPTISISTVAGDNAINQTEDNSDVTISGTTANVEDGRTVTVTLNGETYTTTVSSNAWSVTVPAADTQALDASETVTADVSNTAGDAATQATQAITHTVAAPTISISTVAGDNAINQTEDNSDVTIGGTTANVEDGRNVTVTLNGETYTTTVSSNAWSVTVPAADAQALDASETVTADVSNTAGDAASQASQAISHTIAAPTIAISTVAGDNAINQTEDNSDVTISGTTANVEDGRMVTVTLNGETYTTTVSSNAWSVTVPAADAQALDASETVTADVSNAAGDVATQGSLAITHTVAAPTIAISTVAGDDVISAAEDDSDIAISGTTANVQDGQSVTVMVNGYSYTATVTNNTWAATMPAADAQALGATEVITADVSNITGDAAVQAQHTISHTVTTPLITVNVIAIDDVINATEDDADVTIAGTTANVENGQTVTVTLNSETYTTTVSNNAWAVTLPALDAQALNASNTLTADVANAAGDNAPQATRTLAHTVNLPAITVDAVAMDDVINATEDDNDVSLSGTTSFVEDGQVVSVAINGETYSATVASNRWSTVIPAADAQALAATNTLTADVFNAAGDMAVQATRTIEHTVTGPTISIEVVAGDDVINLEEANSDVSISGTTTNVEDGQQVTVTLNGESYGTLVSNNTWTVTLPAADAQALDASETITANVSNAAGDAATQAERPIEHTVAAPIISIDVVALDDVINQTEDNSDVTITGNTTNVEDGQTVTVTLNGETYTALVNNNVWSVVVTAADAQALNPTETVTADVANAAGDEATQGERSIAHTVLAPMISIDLVATDDAINAIEDDSDITISGTTANVEDGQVVTVVVNGQTYTAIVAANSWSTILPAADAQALGASETITADVMNAAGDAAVQAQRPVAHTVTTPLITINTIAMDDVINTTEDDSDVTISGTTANVEDGQTVTVTLNGKTYTATVNSNAWTITVPAVDAQALDASETVTADVANAAGDDAPQATHVLAHTITLPTITIGVVAGDDVISAVEDNSAVSLSGTTSHVEDGQTVTVAVNGKTYTATVAANAWSTILPAADAQALGASETITADVMNAAGDAAVQAQRPVAHTVTTPLITINTIAMDDVINTTEDDSDVTVSGTTTNVEDGQTVTVTLNGETYTTAVSNNGWAVTLPAADVQALDATETLTADVANAAGDDAPQATHVIAHTIDLPTIAIDVIAGDDVISATEDNSAVTLSGTSSHVEDGQTVTVALNGQIYTATVTANTWSTTLPAADAQALGATETVTADVSNAAGDAAVQAARVVAHSTFDASADDDADGVPNVLDGQGDSDNDGVPNYLDPDSDNDSIRDGLEAGIANSDSNGNGIDDAFDADILVAMDGDGDGLADGVLPLDTDGDNVPDFLDLDSDNDGIPDAIEVGEDPSNPADTDGDGTEDYRDLDSDGDRLADSVEVDGNPLLPPDTDDDGLADFIDTDSDNDGLVDTLESLNLPAPLNMDTNGNGLDDSIDVAITGGDDADSNGVDDRFEPLDTDANDVPDYRDTDADGDAISDALENQSVFDGPFEDTNRNGLPDGLDVLLTLGEDANSNGIDDAFEATDTDSDGIADFQDIDSDNDTLPDAVEGDADIDADGQGNYRDLDSDGDSLSDTLEAGNNPAMPRNSDGDSQPDFIDLDSDNDHLLDSVESSVGAIIDSDGDTVPNHRDWDTDNDGITDLNEVAAIVNRDADSDTIPDRFDADADGDGLIDSGKMDDDSDGISDIVDADVNGNLRADLDGNGIVDTAYLSDTDGDGTPDIIDIDSDNDGLPDLDEVGGFARDTDGDGRINGEDADGNGLIDSVDENFGELLLLPVDTDGDGRPDNLDLDSDGDGLTDLSEAGLTAVDPDGDGIVGTGVFADNNGNGLGDLADPREDGVRAEFIDRDFDGNPDTISLDSDGDGISDLIEAAGNSVAQAIDPDGDGKVGGEGVVLTDNNDNGIADELEGSENNVEARSRVDDDGDGVPDVAEEYLESILVEPPAQPVNPVTGLVDPDQADFDRDGYPDAIEVRFGGDPLNGAEDDSDADGIPDWVENTDIDGDGSNDSDNDGFNDLLELVIGTDLLVADETQALFDAANDYLFSQNRYEGRSVKPVIWVDIAQAGSKAINVAADNGPVTLTGRIGNYHVFGDPRDAATVPVYRWSSDVASLADAVISTTNTAALTVDPSMLAPGLYTVVLSVTLAEHESITEQILEVVATGALRDSDGDRHADDVDDRNADTGYLRTVQTTSGRYLNADSPVVVEGQPFSDKAVRLRAGQLAQANRADGIALSQTELDTAVNSLVARGYTAKDSRDTAFSYEHIYDYEVINLPYVGASARIVIPLNTPVPANAILRKYAPATGWQDFVSDTTDSQATAGWLNGEEGLCPEPGSDAYRPGLNIGDSCLQLAITDGGMNDGENDDGSIEDGQGDVNGLIKDPIAIGTPITASANTGRVETGLRGGGAFEWLGVLMLLSLLIIKFTITDAKNMRKTKRLTIGKILSTAVILLGVTAQANATPRYCEQNAYVDQLPADTALYNCSGWYAGIGLGVSKLEPRIVDLPEALDQTTDTVLPTLFLGYDLNAQWSLEAHYSDQGQATFESGAAIDYSHMGASVLYHLGTHLLGWHAYGKLGVSQLETSLAQGRDDGGTFNYEQLKSTQLHLGAGIEYMARSMWGLRLEALSVDKDSNQITLSLLKRFGRDGGKTRAKPVVAVVPVKPKPEPKPAAPEILCNAPHGVLEGIYFVTGSVRLTTQSKGVLDGVIAQLLPFPKIEIGITAHTDDRGADAYNMQLSQDRAASVRSYLQQRGISNVQSQGFGETRPIDDNNTQQGRANNRRVEIKVLSDECGR